MFSYSKLRQQGEQKNVRCDGLSHLPSLHRPKFVVSFLRLSDRSGHQRFTRASLSFLGSPQLSTSKSRRYSWQNLSSSLSLAPFLKSPHGKRASAWNRLHVVFDPFCPSYVDLQPVGMGAFGLVWYVIIRPCELATVIDPNLCVLLSSAKDQLTGMNVAVKKIMKPFSAPVLAKRTYRELKLLKALRHENVWRDRCPLI